MQEVESKTKTGEQNNVGTWSKAQYRDCGCTAMQRNTGTGVHSYVETLGTKKFRYWGYRAIQRLGCKAIQGL